MKKYVTYEGTNKIDTGHPDVRTIADWLLYYREEIIKSEYPTFSGWIDDMLKTGIFSDVTDKILIYGRNKKSNELSIIEICDNIHDAEKFCEEYGWSYDDGRNNYWLMLEDFF